MHELVARLNIEQYRKLSAKEVDEARRQTLLRLLAEEEANLLGAGARARNEQASCWPVSPLGAQF